MPYGNLTILGRVEVEVEVDAEEEEEEGEEDEEDEEDKSEEGKEGEEQAGRPSAAAGWVAPKPFRLSSRGEPQYQDHPEVITNKQTINK